MPLKGVARDAAQSLDDAARLTGAVNTLLLADTGPQGFNTDVGGIAADLREHGFDGIEAARIVGAGATATSALVGLAALGVRRVHVTARRPQAAASLVPLGESLGVTVTTGALSDTLDPVPLTFATLPGGAEVAEGTADTLAARGGVLYDVVYGHWPTALARAWERQGSRAVPGIGMLVHQALRQVRVFCGGRPDVEVPDEEAVLAAMRASVIDD
jgi:shikimate dehydrogenase